MFIGAMYEFYQKMLCDFFCIGNGNVYLLALVKAKRFGLAIAVFIGKKKMMTNNQTNKQNHLIKPPENLESQVINVTVIGLVMFSLLSSVLYWGR